MPKSAKIGLIVGGVILGIAIILLSLGFVFSRFVFKNSAHELFQQSYIDTTTISKDFDSAEKLSLKIAYGDVTVTYGDKFYVFAKDVEEKLFEANMDGNTLEIKYDDEFLGGGLRHLGNIPTPVFNITVPQDFKLSEFEVECGAAKIVINDINAFNVEFETGAGDIEARNINFDNFDFNGGAGGAEIQGVLTGKIYVETGVGEVILDIIGNIDDYDIETDCGVGSVRINDQEYEGIGSQHSKNNNGASNSIFASCGVGSVDIQIEE